MPQGCFNYKTGTQPAHYDRKGVSAVDKLPLPEQVARMIVGGCLRKALVAAEAEANGRSVAEVLLTDSLFHGTFLHRGDLESIARWLGVSLYGENSRLDDVFQFVQDTLSSEYGDRFNQEASGTTIALDRQAPRITFAPAPAA